jgi:general secretion pathway protein A
MYENFFGFREKPFKLVPNPAYLFLSKSHEEALAHLNYAMAQGDGFVEISGEVGTGKTTLCRAFLENLDENTIAAYIFNPRMAPIQLIKTINDELGIKYDTNNTKDLVDKLNAFLIRKRKERKKVILLIDEAQNLSRNILEQLRLLSNLETNREKLLQIILVGQPELSDILDSHDLRQLGQRITLRYHLTPLNLRETIEYIQYRVNIAARKTAIKFDRSAFRQIYNYSEGIPRVINIVCDRALLTAFGLSQQRISGAIARTAIKELRSRGSAQSFNFLERERALIILAALSIVLVAAIFHKPLLRGLSSFLAKPSDHKIGVATANVPDLQTPSALKPETRSNQIESENESLEPSHQEALKLSNYLATMDIQSSRKTALRHAMELWQTPVEFKPYLNSLDDNPAFFRLTAKPSGISIHRIETNLDMLKKLNLPAILEIYPPGSDQPGYLTLSKVDGDRLNFGGPENHQIIEAETGEIHSVWSGIAYIPWKNFLSIWGTIPLHSNKESTVTLKLLLHELGFNNIELNNEYDDWTRHAIEEMQAKYGIPVDGFVGPLTKIVLYRETNSFEMPYLVE